MSECTDTSTPFFVVGAVRSGTTLLRLMLGHHPEICRCEEMEYVVGDIVPQDVREDTKEYVRRLKLDRGFRMSGYRINEQLDYPAMAFDFMSQRRFKDGRRLVGATVHHHFDRLPGLWPNARFIFLNRDPRDVARSCVEQGWGGTPWRASEFWLNAQSAWQRLRETVDADQRLEVYFESLAAEPQQNLDRICAFLGVEYDPAMLEINKDTTYSPPDPANARSWRDSATEDEIAQVESRVGLEALKSAGYEPSGLPLLSDSVMTRLRITFTDLQVRMLARVRKYGVVLWLQGLIARRLPWQGLRDRIRMKMDAVDNLHLK